MLFRSQLKAQIKTTKDAINEEKIRIKAQQDANLRIAEQIETLKKRQKLWLAKKDEDINKLERNLIDLSKIDIDVEIANHKTLARVNTMKQIETQLNNSKTRLQMWQRKHDEAVQQLQSKIDRLSNIDIDGEIANHRSLELHREATKRVAEAKRWMASIEADNEKENKIQQKLIREISQLENHKCYACGGDIHDANQESMIESKKTALKESALQIIANNGQYFDHGAVLQQFADIGDAPTVIYKTMEEALSHRAALEELQNNLQSQSNQANPYGDEIGRAHV